MPDAVPATSLEVRERLVEALNLDLIGPGAGHELASERLPGWVRPSNWYLTGFLIPAGAPPEQSGDTDEDDNLDEMPESAGLAEESTEERKAAKKGFFPSSMGLSFLVPEGSDTLSATVRWADYRPVPIEDDDGKAASVWQREQNEHTEPVSLERAGDYDIADSDGLALHAEVRTIDTAGIAGIPAGTRSVSVFLVNRREPDEDNPDLAYAFQAEIEVQGEHAFVPRPDLRGAQAEDWDEQVADLHYADTPELATGHGVSADWAIVDGACRRLRTAWIPSASVEKTETRDVPAVELSMEALGALDDGAAAEGALRPLVDEYRAWIEGRREEMDSPSGRTTRHGRGPAAPRCPRRGQDRARHRVAGVERGRTRCVPGGEPGRRERTPPAPRRAVRRSAAASLAGLPARVHSVEPAGPRGPARSAPGDRGPAVLPDRRRQDGGVPGSRSLHDGASTPPQPRPERRPGRRGEHHHALHPASAHPGPARPRFRPGLRAGARTRSGRRAVRRVAVRDRPLGRQGRDAQPHGPQGRKTQRFGARQDPSVQDEPQGKPLPDPARELSVVRNPVRARLLRPPARRRPSEGASRRLRELRVRFQRRPAAADSGRGRVHLPPSPRLPDCDR